MKRCSRATVAFPYGSSIETSQDNKLKVGSRFASWKLRKLQSTRVGPMQQLKTFGDRTVWNVREQS